MRQKGFTLIELMIVVMVVAILAAIAIPNYREYTQRGRRADAMQAVGDLKLRLERWRAENPSYASGCSGCVSGTYPTVSDTSYYDLSVNANATTYTITASPINAQSGDRCGSLTATQATPKLVWSGEANCNN